jgi:hypothetical protein
MEDPRSRSAVEVFDRYVDGKVTDDEYCTTYEVARDAAQNAARNAGFGAAVAAAAAGLRVAWDAAVQAARDAQLASSLNALMPLGKPVGNPASVAATIRDRALQTERTAQADLVREFVCSPFRPVTLDLNVLLWNNGIISALAHAMYEDQSTTPSQILADALEDAGCEDVDILGHLRGPGPHVRGCWVVDFLLGKK